MIRITLCRHGETHNNRARVVQGQDPTQGKLTPKGLDQARRLGERLAKVPFEVAYCSPLERAVLTMAQVLAARPGERTVPLHFPPELREVNLGVLHGRPHTEWKAAIHGDPMTWRPERGESWIDVQDRVTDYLRRTILRGGQRTILIVAHGGVNRGLIASLTGITMGQAWEPEGIGTPQENTCINQLDLDDNGTLVAATVNDTLHLKPEPEAGAGQRWLVKERRWEVLGAHSGGGGFELPLG
ncbi:MAG TPA: histidine phosphatase family protein [bacterium]